MRIEYNGLMEPTAGPVSKPGRKTRFYHWSAKISRLTLPVLQRMAAALGFINDVPGGKFGWASPPRFLDALAHCYEVDPDGTRNTLEELLRRHGQLPTQEKTAG